MGRAKGWSGKLSKFGKFLQTHGVERDKIAEAAGVTPSYISMLAHGKAQPGFRRAIAIQNWTAENLKDDAGNPAPFSCTDWGV